MKGDASSGVVFSFRFRFRSLFFSRRLGFTSFFLTTPTLPYYSNFFFSSISATVEKKNKSVIVAGGGVSSTPPSLPLPSFLSFCSLPTLTPFAMDLWTSLFFEGDGNDKPSEYPINKASQREAEGERDDELMGSTLPCFSSIESKQNLSLDCLLLVSPSSQLQLWTRIPIHSIFCFSRPILWPLVQRSTRAIGRSRTVLLPPLLFPQDEIHLTLCAENQAERQATTSLLFM